MNWAKAIALLIVALAMTTCATDHQTGTTPAKQISLDDCSLNGHSVSCMEFHDQIMTESIADFTGLDCNAMTKVADARRQEWALAEATGKVSEDERYYARRAISSAVWQLGCGNSVGTTSARQTSLGDCSLNGRSVSCKVFQDQITTESIADFTGLDCNTMARFAGLRIEGWALAEATGKVSNDEGYYAGRAISLAVSQLGCGDSKAWQAYLKSLP